jgi:hypothetical protein
MHCFAPAVGRATGHKEGVVSAFVGPHVRNPTGTFLHILLLIFSISFVDCIRKFSSFMWILNKCVAHFMVDFALFVLARSS